jgi:hypothetical protein
VRDLDAPDGEAGVLHRPVLLPHVPGLVRANVHECFSPVGEHQLPTLVLSVRLQPHAPGKLSLVDACENPWARPATLSVPNPRAPGVPERVAMESSLQEAGVAVMRKAAANEFPDTSRAHAIQLVRCGR